ncbi:hypothetical protein MKEN_00215800 [Mycena kentingensis (nom. inval.)]|nr:hypothetical protein MKEN_00215800 [Mycena kentingensis (nom. inval.)]
MSSDDSSEPVTIVINDIEFFNTSTGQPSGWYPSSTNSLHAWFPGRFDDTIFVPDPPERGVGPAWVLAVDGRAITLYGVSPPRLPKYNQTIGIAAPDDDAAKPAKPETYTDYTWPAPATGGVLYASGRLAAATQMKLGLTGFRGTAFNYAVVEVGEFTALEGRTILVDETSAEVAWRGAGWTTRSAAEYVESGSTKVQCQLPALPFDGKDLSMTTFAATMYPHGNSTRVSATSGDGFEFMFAGTSIAVYGISPGPASSQSWQLKVLYTLDGTQNTTLTYTSASISDATALTTHFLYFSATALEAGNHSLVATILDVAGTAGAEVKIDYLTYQPTFGTVHDKPRFQLSSGDGGGGGTAAGGEAAAGNATDGGSAGGDGAGNKVPVGAIVGAAVGAVIFALLIFLGLFCFRRRRQQRRKRRLAPQLDLTSEPFLAHPSSSFRKIFPGPSATSPGPGPSTPSSANTTSSPVFPALPPRTRTRTNHTPTRTLAFGEIPTRDRAWDGDRGGRTAA